MFRIEVSLKSESPITFGKAIREKRGANETYDQCEERTWKQRAHTSNNHLIIPSTMFKGALDEAAKYLNKKIVGEGNATYSKHFRAGVVIENDIDLPVTLDELEGQWVNVPADGKRGGTSRVDRCFPIIESWEGKINVTVLDSKINVDVFEEVAKAAGLFIGMGTFRPIKGGNHGRFSVTSVKKI